MIAVRLLDRGGINLMIAGDRPVRPRGDGAALVLAGGGIPGVPVMLALPRRPNPERTRDATPDGGRDAVLRFPMPANDLRAAVTQACEGSNPIDPQAANGSATPTASPRRRLGRTLAVPGRFDRRPPDPLRRHVGRGRAPPSRGPPAQHRYRGRVHASLLPDSDVCSATTPRSGRPSSWPRPSRRPGPPVLIVGEQGTGKTLIARSIHQQSGRRDQPFIEVSCGGIDELGLERELFGQKFEGSDGFREDRPARPGPIAGTLLLDEVAALSPALQARAPPA